MNQATFKKNMAIGMLFLFLCTCFTPSCLGSTRSISYPPASYESLKSSALPELAVVTCYTIGGVKSKPVQVTTISAEDAQQLIIKLHTLEDEIQINHLSEKAQQIQQDILLFAERHGLLPPGLSSKTYLSRLTDVRHMRLPWILSQPVQVGSDSEFLCNFITTGSGSALPIIILPRLIPILLTPIPRVFVRWDTPDGVTSVGGLRSRTGFIAVGEQKGVALGFWGIGFSVFLPPVSAYGLFGYAFYARVNADTIEQWPPNNPPEITGTDPANGEEYIPLSTSELRFQIADADEDLMSFTVTTEPDIGSGSGGLKTDGLYTVPISGLESLTTYTWHIQVNDGKDVVEQTLTFTTEPIAPVVSNPIPADGTREVSPDLSQLKFSLKDFQGDKMDYTVETSPNIGSGSLNQVSNGTYTVQINGLTKGKAYYWFVNATDGTHWTRKIFAFETTYPDHFDPFVYGWHYRKQITIDHTTVGGGLSNFPVLVSTVDSDLHEKTQGDGDDILFMDDTGVATKLNHEIEDFDTTSGTLVAWVKIPSVSSTQDTIFYMYYGNEACLTKENVEGTWNNGYKLVYHLNEASGSAGDSTSNRYTGTIQGDVLQGQTGKISTCYRFAGNADYVDFSDFVMNSYSVEMWLNIHDVTKAMGNAFLCYDTGLSAYSLGVWSQNDANKQLYVSISGRGYEINVAASTWYHIVLIYDSSTKACKYYINGVLENDVIATTSYNANAKYIGYPNINCLDGLVDECRISTIALPDGWAQTSYNNQNDPASFMNIGLEESGP